MRIGRIVVLAAAVACVSEGCRRKAPSEPPLARPSISLSQDRAPLGSPIDITYRFEVDAKAPAISENYKVFVGVVDSDGELMWTDDHDPPVPTSQWKPGQKVEYTRRKFIPIYPYIGEASIRMGLYSPASQKRLTLAGEDAGQHAYKVARIQLLPQTENIFMVFKDGWHGPETPPNNPQDEWQWTRKKEATIAFKNPKQDVVFYLDLDNPSTSVPDQHVAVKMRDQVVKDFIVRAERQLQEIPLAASQLGTDDMVDLVVAVDKTFVPALVPGSTNKDPRELGVRVFHAFVQPKK